MHEDVTSLPVLACCSLSVEHSGMGEEEEFDEGELLKNRQPKAMPKYIIHPDSFFREMDANTAHY